MPKTPLRALRVSDELWHAAQARALERGETVSAVVRRGLVSYVGVRPQAAPKPAVDSGFLLAQGMLMQRHGIDAEAAATYLRGLAQTSQTTVRETAERLVDGLAEAQPAAARA